MKIDAKSAAAGAVTLMVLVLAVHAVQCEPVPGFPPDQAAGFGEGNIQRIQQLLVETSAPDGRLDDYYFVLIGDVQNGVRSFHRDVFESIARDIHGAMDERSGTRLYDRIRFVILLGDLVYEGPSDRQWDHLEGALAGKGPDSMPYPFIALLARDKPVFPALGNHEILSFRPYPQTRYKDLFDSPAGVANFKRFFSWDRLIANRHVLYPVPADLPEDAFREVLKKSQDPQARSALVSNYVVQPDGRYHLKFFEGPPLQVSEFRARKERLAEQLAPLFRQAGYGTLPVLSSDNMVSYAVDTGDLVYLFLDSMARGWHYPVFARLKQALYPDKKDQHRLNLFTDSPLNGQADFYRAVAAYAHERGKTVVPMMHHSAFNSSKNIHATGIGYNLWLALGFPQTRTEQGDPTIFDEIIFSDASHFFSACVHGFESFSLTAKTPGQPAHTLRWFVSGGGGGPLRKAFYPERIKEIETLYNQKTARETGPAAGRSIEVRDDQTRIGHHYLLVHVQDGRIVDVSPRFINQQDLPQARIRPQLTLKSSYYSGPSSVGAALEFSPGAWGLEGVRGYLAFVNWRPSVSLGLVDYDTRAAGSSTKARAATLEVSPLTLDVYIPRSKVVTLRLPGLELWNGRANLRRYFVTMAVEMPLFYNLFGRLENLSVGIKAYVPLHPGKTDEPDLGHRTKVGVSVGYTFRH